MSKLDDIEAVRAAMEAYIAATRDSDETGMREIFHPNAMLAGWLGQSLRDGSPEPFFRRMGSTPAGEGYRATIPEISIIGRSATATVIEDGLWDTAFVNRFHLVKQADGSWIITAKLFHCGDTG